MAGQAKTYTVTLNGGRKGAPRYTRHVDSESGTTFRLGHAVEGVTQDIVDRLQSHPKVLWKVEPKTTTTKES